MIKTVIMNPYLKLKKNMNRSFRKVKIIIWRKMNNCKNKVIFSLNNIKKKKKSCFYNKINT